MDFLKLHEDGITIKDIRDAKKRRTGNYVLAAVALTAAMVVVAAVDFAVKFL